MEIDIMRHLCVCLTMPCSALGHMRARTPQQVDGKRCGSASKKRKGRASPRKRPRTDRDDASENGDADEDDQEDEEGEEEEEG